MGIPKVFISYSHDSREHKLWVLNLATRLRQASIDAILDQWELKAGGDIPHFMEKHLVSSDYILMVCTKRYVEKANEGKGGVGYEKMIVTSELLQGIETNKFIPIIRQEGSKDVPTFLKTKLHIDFSISEDWEYNFDELIRTILNSPIYEKPELGSNPFDSENASEPLKTVDTLRTLMKIIVDQYERKGGYISYSALIDEMRISRIMTDMLIKDAIKKKYIRKNEYGDIYLQDNGRFYAIENKLI